MKISTDIKNQDIQSQNINSVQANATQKDDAQSNTKTTQEIGVIATISEKGKNYYENNLKKTDMEDSLLSRVTKEEELLKSNYYLKHEEGYYKSELEQTYAKDIPGNIYDADPKVLANNLLNSYGKLYNEIMQDSETNLREQRIKYLDTAYKEQSEFISTGIDIQNKKKRNNIT